MNKELADLLFPNLVKFRKDFEAMYPKRDLPAGAEVLRVAPSPTGPMHIGTVYMSLISKAVAVKTGGVFMLRIEDTDTVREVDGAREFIIKTLQDYDINPDEGENMDGGENGKYGPYRQSKRKDIYAAFAYDAVLNGYAYPCFMTEEELAEMRDQQTANKIRTGVYAEYARDRNLTLEEIKTKISNGEKYILRLKASGYHLKKNKFVDEFLGEQNIPENDEDFPLIKKDNLPTYHFAHVVDDYLMGTTFVTRGEEWLSSLGKHLELWDKIGAPAPKYGHIMPINKNDNGSVRKLSKRKDSEATMMFYQQSGYTKESIIAYLYRLANPDFDTWWETNRDVSKYLLDMDAMKRSSRGPLLDFKKLDDISSDVIASKSASVVADELLSWSLKYDTEFYNVISKDRKYLEQVLNIERQTENPRKDIVRYGVAREQIGYFFDDMYVPASIDSNLKSKMCVALQDEALYNNSLNLDDWILRIKDIAANVAPDIKFGAFMMELRKGITGKERTPNMYYLFEVLGRERILKRLA
jgi:glutamyl-tRNA synthetase